MSKIKNKKIVLSPDIYGPIIGITDKYQFCIIIWITWNDTAHDKVYKKRDEMNIKLTKVVMEKYIEINISNITSANLFSCVDKLYMCPTECENLTTDTNYDSTIMIEISCFYMTEKSVMIKFLQSRLLGQILMEFLCC